MKQEQGFSTAEAGASAVEYAIMIALIAVVIFGAVTALGLQVFGTFDCLADAVLEFPDPAACLP